MTIKMNNISKRLFMKELVSYKKRSSTYLSPIVFFLITISLYPLALSNDPNDLALLAPGITWICVLLSTLLSIQNIFNEDFEDGSLDIFFSLRSTTLSLVLIKILVNWIFSSLPIIILSSTVVFLLFLPPESLTILLISLLLGTPVISLFGALAGALSLGKSSILGPAIVLPLSLPVLILGTASVSSFLNGEDPTFYFLLLLAIFIFLLPLICYACIGALRLHYE
ncbi:MAG: heme exporter protein CcmB [Gammaproteobacteria bacterium]